MDMGKKWTPGPWHASDAASIWNSDRTDEIADAWDHGRGARATQANAHLIAAAPDLYEALEAAVDCGMVPKSTALNGGASKYSRQVLVADMIRAALAKARGEADNEGGVK